jgi:nicotinamidase-related amidase
MLRFTPDDAAIVLIDHQVGTCSWIGSITQDELTRNVGVIAQVAARLKMPVALTSSMETNVQGLLMPAIQQALPDAYAARVKRAGIVNAMDDPNFAKSVYALGRRNLIMAGATTDVCAVPPAVTLLEAGYNVKVIVDCCGSPTKMADDIAIERLIAAGVPLTTTNAIVSELVHDWSTPAGQAAFSLLAPATAAA